MKPGKTGERGTVHDAHTWHVEPNDASKGSAAQDNRRPEPATLVVPFETGGSTVRDDETKHGTQPKWRGSINRKVWKPLRILTPSGAWAERRGGVRIWRSR